MDTSDIKVLKLSGETLSLRERLEDVVQALDRDGCVLVKEATDLTTIEPVLLSNLNSSDTVTREIFLNECVKQIIFTARKDDFYITAYQAYKVGFGSEEVFGREKQWREMAAMAGLVGASCIHLGGSRTVQWKIKVDKGIRGEVTSDTATLNANGGDIFICNHWLRRSAPRLQKQPPTEAFFIAVSYMQNELGLARFYPPRVIDRVIQLAGDACVSSGEFVTWKCANERDNEVEA